MATRSPSVPEFDRWCEDVPASIRRDALWRMTVYRLALYVSDLGWEDVTRLHADVRTRSLADQLFRAIGSISANVAEGYARGSGKDRARFYEYALGSARESRDWYFKARHLLGAECAEARMERLAEIIRLLLTMVARQDGHTLREPAPPYQLATDDLA